MRPLVALVLVSACSTAHVESVDASTDDAADGAVDLAFDGYAEDATDAAVEDSPDGAVDGGPWISCADFLPLLRRADCMAWSRCQLGGRDREFFDVDACVPRIFQPSCPSDPSRYDGYAAARCVVNPSYGCRFQEATGWWSIQSWDCFSAVFGPDITAAPTTVALGDTCDDEPVTRADGGIATFAACPAGAFCDRICKLPPEEGEPCHGGGGGDDCGPMLACSPAFTDGAGTGAGTCVPMVIATTEGAACNDRTSVCDEHARLFCEFPSRTCVLEPTGGTGTPCAQWNAAESMRPPCDVGLRCTSGPTLAKTCQPSSI